MSSLAELPDLKGFFSYSRSDDELSRGSLSRLRAQIYNELRLQLGLNFKLWQDTEAIAEGTEWEDEIKRAISESVFFIPIVTPSSVASIHCRKEFEAFIDREQELGRKNLVFPLLYVRVPALEKEELWRRDPLLGIIGRRQYFDWQKFRHRSFTEGEIAERIEQFCRNIVESLQQPWISLEDRRAAEAQAQRLAEQARRDEDEKDRQQAEAEARRQAEQQQRAAEAAKAAKARRIAEQARRDQDEKDRQQAEAEARRQAEQQQRIAEQARRDQEEKERLRLEAEYRQKAEQELRREEAEAQRLADQEKEEPATQQPTEVQPTQFERVRLSLIVMLCGATLLFAFRYSYFLFEHLWAPPPPANVSNAPANPPSAAAVPPTVPTNPPPVAAVPAIPPSVPSGSWPTAAPLAPLVPGNFMCTFYRLQNNLDPNKVAILIDSDVGEGQTKIQPAVRQRGYTVTARMVYPSTTKDFAQYVSQADLVANMIIHCGPSSYAFEYFLNTRGRNR